MPTRRYTYEECPTCHAIARKDHGGKPPEHVPVRPFTVEHLGVYAEGPVELPFAEEDYRAELLKLYGAEPGDAFLHGRKDDGWVHVPRLWAPVTRAMLEPLAALVKQTPRKVVTVLADRFDGVTTAERDAIELETGVKIVLRRVPVCAIDAIERTLSPAPKPEPHGYEIHRFYAELCVGLRVTVEPDRLATISLVSCEVDMESFLASQRPARKPMTSGMTRAAQVRADTARKAWEAREAYLRRWVIRQDSWKEFVDYWEVDVDFGEQRDPTGAPIFLSRWQSFRLGKAKKKQAVVFEVRIRYTEPGTYAIAANVVDLFGNEGRVVEEIEVK